MHGLDPGKLVLSGAAAVRHSLPPAPTSSRLPGVVLYPQPVHSARVQPAHLFIRSPRPREQRRRAVAQVGTRPVPFRRTELTWKQFSGLLSASILFDLVWVFNNDQIGLAKFLLWLLKVRAHTHTSSRALTPRLVPHCSDVLGDAPPARLPIHGPRR